ncbi:MAG: MFS transporter [Verrucomicrobiales bacterium]|nr:MFS transporter [Verrucomicrobiales bacterium]
MSNLDAPNRAALPLRTAVRSFWCLFVTQFQGAFSDNVFKFLVMFLIIRTFPPAQRDHLVPVVGAVFALPFILFSMGGGYLADRFSKRDVAVALKLAEAAIMTLATLGLALHHVPLLLGVVFLMSAQSAFFGPTKYSLLPELLPEKLLSWGNGLIGMGTFLAIIAGTIAAGALSRAFGDAQVWSGVVLVALALLGTASAAGIRRLPAAGTTRAWRLNFLADWLAQFRGVRRDRTLLVSMLAANYIWFLGALLQPALLFHGKDVFGLDDFRSALLQATVAVGIGLGCAASGYLSGKKIELGFVPLGATGLALFGALLARPGLPPESFALTLVCLGFWGGFYLVPVNALIQHRPEPGAKGGVVATSALLSWFGILAASGVYHLLRNVAALEQTSIFLFGAGLSLVGAVAFCVAMPYALKRLALWARALATVRLQLEGRDHIPERGAAVFVCRAASPRDLWLLEAVVDRPVRCTVWTPTSGSLLPSNAPPRNESRAQCTHAGAMAALRAVRDLRKTLATGHLAALWLPNPDEVPPLSPVLERLLNRAAGNRRVPLVPVVIENDARQRRVFRRGARVQIGSPLPPS